MPLFRTVRVIGAIGLLAGASLAAAVPPAQPDGKKTLYGHVPVGVTLDYGDGGEKLKAGNVPTVLSTMVITCRNPRGCTIQTVTMATLQSSDTTPDYFSICATLDGRPMHPACPTAGIWDGPKGYGPIDNATVLQYFSTAVGDHTVTVSMSSDFNAVVGPWQVTYNVLVP